MDAGLDDELAVDVAGGDEGLQRAEIGQLEVPDAGVVRVREEEWLAVAAVLGGRGASRVSHFVFFIPLHFHFLSPPVFFFFAVVLVRERK